MKYLFTIFVLVLLINISNAQTLATSSNYLYAYNGTGKKRTESQINKNLTSVSYYNPRNYDAKKTRNRIITISVGATAATIGTVIWMKERKKYHANKGNYKNKPIYNDGVMNAGRALFITGTITFSIGIFIL